MKIEILSMFLFFQVSTMLLMDWKSAKLLVNLAGCTQLITNSVLTEVSQQYHKEVMYIQYI